MTSELTDFIKKSKAAKRF